MSEIFVRPGLSHQAQFTVEIRNRQSNSPFALRIQFHRCRLLRDNLHFGQRFQAAAIEIIAAVTTKPQCAETTTALNQLSIDIILVHAVAFAAEEGVIRIRRFIVGDIEHTGVHGGNQHIHFFRCCFAVLCFCFDFNGQILIRTDAGRRIQCHINLTGRIGHRDMQDTDRAFDGRLTGAVARADNHRSRVQVVACPLFVQRDFHIDAAFRHIHFLPPQRAVTGFQKHIAFTGLRCSHIQFNFITGVIIWFIQFQFHLIRANRTGTAGVILPGVPSPETHAAGQPGGRIHHFQAVCTPGDRDGHFCGAVFGDTDFVIRHHEVFLIITG